jgi:hypothetical protein
MGAEAKCTARFDGKTTEGKARLETETLEFRGPNVSLSIPFGEIKRVTARDGALTVDSHNGAVSLMLGDAAEKWAFKIQHPPSRLDKIGVKPEWRVSVLGVSDEAFLGELERAVSQVSIGRVLKESDAIFVGATREAELARLAKLKDALKSNGALWVIRPKGRPEISERAVMAAGKAAGLVDVKVVSFSPTHTAEKFVIPVHRRRSREGHQGSS